LGAKALPLQAERHEMLLFSYRVFRGL